MEKPVLTILPCFVLLLLVILIEIPDVHADTSQWIGMVTFDQSGGWFSEKATFTFRVFSNGTITGNGTDTKFDVGPGYCEPYLERPNPFSVKGNFSKNVNDFVLEFTNFTQSKLSCPSYVNGNPPYVAVPSLLNDVIVVPAEDGGTYNGTQSTVNGERLVTLTIHENPNATPEFGSVATTVLLISILSIIILSFKTRFLNRI